jgi:hypothetical protein
MGILDAGRGIDDLLNHFSNCEKIVLVWRSGIPVQLLQTIPAPSLFSL